jgi:hypothetical protein
MLYKLFGEQKFAIIDNILAHKKITVCNADVLS